MAPSQRCMKVKGIDTGLPDAPGAAGGQKLPVLHEADIFYEMDVGIGALHIGDRLVMRGGAPALRRKWTRGAPPSGHDRQSKMRQFPGRRRARRVTAAIK